MGVLHLKNGISEGNKGKIHVLSKKQTESRVGGSIRRLTLNNWRVEDKR